MIIYVGKESEKEWMCVDVSLNHFAVQQKWLQHCKSTILQWNLNKIDKQRRRKKEGEGGGGEEGGGKEEVEDDDSLNFLYHWRGLNLLAKVPFYIIQSSCYWFKKRTLRNSK